MTSKFHTALILSLILSIVGHAQNMLVNSGFESDISGTWSLKYSQDAAGSYVHEQTIVRSGAKALHVENTSVPDGNLFGVVYLKNESSLSLESGKDYQFSIYAKGEVSGKRMKLVLLVPNPEGAGMILKSSTVITLTDEYHLYHHTFTPDLTSTEYIVRIYFGADAGNYYFDDASFVNLSDATNNVPVISSFTVKKEEQGEQGALQIIGRCVASDADTDNLDYSFRVVSGGGTIESVDATSFLYHEDQSGEIVFEVAINDNNGGIVSQTTSFNVLGSNPNELYSDQTVWEAHVAQTPNFVGHEAFGFAEANPDLPNVLLIGNSISIGYTATVQSDLAAVANVYRIPSNGGDTRTMLSNQNLWLGARNWDVIHFNFGLHDLKRLVNNQLDINGERNVSIEEYTQNMTSIVETLKGASDKVIFATTSVIPEGAAGRLKGDEVLYNEAAMGVMNSNSEIIIDDQYKLTSEYPEEQMTENVHFLPTGRERQGHQVAAKINEVLDEGSSTPTDPTSPADPAILTAKLPNLNMEIYPNPFFHDLTINVNDLVYDKIKVELYNLSGKKAHSQIFDFGQPLTLSLSHLAQGEYSIVLAIKDKNYSYLIVRK